MAETFDDTGDKAIQRIDALIRERPSHREVLEFLKAVLTEQHKTRTEIKTVAIEMDEEMVMGLPQGLSLLKRKTPSLDMGAAAALFRRLCEALSRRKEASGDVKRINQALNDSVMNLAELFKHATIENAEYISVLSRKLKVREDLLSFLANNSIKPIFEAYANELKGYVNLETWWRGYCPICGSQPFIAELGPEGERFLVCSLCSFQWRFGRLMCPFCGNTDHQGLRYFYSENGGKANRVDVCDRCKRYIKAIDIRESDKEIIPIVEDMRSLYLDLLAQSEGYRR